MRSCRRGSRPVREHAVQKELARLTTDKPTRPDSMVKDKEREEPRHGPPRSELPAALLCLIQVNP